MQIAGTAYNFLPYAQPSIRPAIEWVQDSSGYWSGSDRGAAQDIYESKVSFAGTEATLDALQQTIEANREGLTLSDFSSKGQEIFGPDVDYYIPISSAVIEYGLRNHIHLNKVSTLDLTFRAIGIYNLDITPSLASLRLQEGWEGDQDWTAARAFTYGQAGVYADHRGDVGRLVGRFIQKPEEAESIMDYLTYTARANTVVLPTFPGVTYPFGRPRGAGPFNCKIPKWEISRLNLNRWAFKIEFVEAA